MDERGFTQMKIRGFWRISIYSAESVAKIALTHLRLSAFICLYLRLKKGEFCNRRWQWMNADSRRSEKERYEAFRWCHSSLLRYFQMRCPIARGNQKTWSSDRPTGISPNTSVRHACHISSNQRLLPMYRSRMATPSFPDNIESAKCGCQDFWDRSTFGFSRSPIVFQNSR